MRTMHRTKPNVMHMRAFRLLTSRWPDYLTRIRNRRASSRLNLREAIASLVWDVRTGRLR